MCCMVNKSCLFLPFLQVILHVYHIYTINFKYHIFTIIYCMDVVNTSRKYHYVALPKNLYTEIERLIYENKSLGFLSVADFVRDAVREKILEIRKEVKNLE